MCSSITSGSPLNGGSSRKTSFELQETSGSLSRSDGESSSSLHNIAFIPPGLQGGLTTVEVMQMLAD